MFQKSNTYKSIDKLIILVLLFVHLTPLYTNDYFLTQDSPSHLYNGYVLKSILSSDNYLLSEYFTFQFSFSPNLVSTLLYTVFSFIFSQQITYVLIHIIIWVLLPFSVYYLLIFNRKENGFLTVFVFPFLYSFPFILGFDSFCLGLSLALLLYGAYMWFRDVVNEAEHQGHHTPVVQIHHRYGMTLFIASEVMFFVAWFWAYFDASLFPSEFVGNVWPPKNIETLDAWDLPLINTLILLLSGTTVTWSHHALLEDDRKSFIQGLILTVILGFSFTLLQIYEYSHAAFDFSGHIYGSVFYMATGFHGFHVLVGTIFLAVCLFRGKRGHFNKDHHFGFEAAAWYWHFVDVVWLFLFAAIYVWGS